VKQATHITPEHAVDRLVAYAELLPVERRGEYLKAVYTVNEQLKMLREIQALIAHMRPTDQL
jgi:hypothetical protein